VIEEAYNWRWALYGILLFAAASDIQSYRIPNALPLSVIGTLFVALIVSGARPDAYGVAATSALIGLAVGYAFFFFRLMGGGDGKLFAASAAWFEPSSLIVVALMISLAGIAVSLTMLGLRLAAPRQESGLQTPVLKTAVPYGVAIMAGVIAAAEFAG